MSGIAVPAACYRFPPQPMTKAATAAACVSAGAPVLAMEAEAECAFMRIPLAAPPAAIRAALRRQVSWLADRRLNLPSQPFGQWRCAVDALRIQLRGQLRLQAQALTGFPNAPCGAPSNLS